jgi:tetratricopeptide (TPR) repeat protein
MNRPARAVWLLITTLVCVGCAEDATPQAERRGAEPPAFDTEPMQPPVARALLAARRSVLDAPDSAPAWGRLGMVADAHDLYREAELCYLRAHELDPGNFYWIYLLAVVQDFLGRDAETISASFEAAMRISPLYPPAPYRYGEALARKGRLEEARQSYARAVELDPDFAMARRGLGQMLLRLGEVEAATRELEKAAELDPTDALVRTALAQAYFQLGDREGAEREAELSGTLSRRLAVPDPVRFEMELHAVDSKTLGRRYRERMATGDFRGAVDDLTLLEEQFPDNATVQLRLGSCYLGLGDLESARVHLARAVEMQDDLVDAHLDLARIYSGQQRFADAAEHYRRARTHAPERPEVLVGLAETVARQGESEEALALFASAAALAPTDVGLRHRWGTVLMERGDFEAAAEQFRIAVEVDPAALESRYHLGFVLEFLGRIEEARREYERVVEIVPDHVAAQRLAGLDEPVELPRD